MLISLTIFLRTFIIWERKGNFKINTWTSRQCPLNHITYDLSLLATSIWQLECLWTIVDDREHTHLNSQLDMLHLCQLTQFYLFSFWCNGIQLINEDNGWRVLLCLFKSFPQIALGFTSKFTHDFWTWKQTNCSILYLKFFLYHYL